MDDYKFREFPQCIVRQDVTFGSAAGVTLAHSPWACSVERTKLLGHTTEAVSTTTHIVGHTLALTTNDEWTS